MKHEDVMNHAVTLATAFIQNGDIRHNGNFNDNSATPELVSMLLVQMYRAVLHASMETHTEEAPRLG